MRCAIAFVFSSVLVALIADAHVVDATTTTTTTRAAAHSAARPEQVQWYKSTHFLPSCVSSLASLSRSPFPTTTTLLLLVLSRARAFTSQVRESSRVRERESANAVVAAHPLITLTMFQETTKGSKDKAKNGSKDVETGDEVRLYYTLSLYPTWHCTSSLFLFTATHHDFCHRGSPSIDVHNVHVSLVSSRCCPLDSYQKIIRRVFR